MSTPSYIVNPTKLMTLESKHWDHELSMEELLNGELAYTVYVNTAYVERFESTYSGVSILLDFKDADSLTELALNEEGWQYTGDAGRSILDDETTKEVSLYQAKIMVIANTIKSLLGMGDYKISDEYAMVLAAPNDALLLHKGNVDVFRVDLNTCRLSSEGVEQTITGYDVVNDLSMGSIIIPEQCGDLYEILSVKYKEEFQSFGQSLNHLVFDLPRLYRVPPYTFRGMFHNTNDAVELGSVLYSLQFCGCETLFSRFKDHQVLILPSSGTACYAVDVHTEERIDIDADTTYSVNVTTVMDVMNPSRQFALKPSSVNNAMFVVTRRDLTVMNPRGKEDGVQIKGYILGNNSNPKFTKDEANEPISHFGCVVGNEVLRLEAMAVPTYADAVMMIEEDIVHSAEVPTGDSTERVGPTEGQFRDNTDTMVREVFQDGEWVEECKLDENGHALPHEPVNVSVSTKGPDGPNVVTGSDVDKAFGEKRFDPEDAGYWR